MDKTKISLPALILLQLFFLLIFSPALASIDIGEPQHIMLPRSETEGLVNEWLKGKNYVLSREEKTGSFVISATKIGIKMEITLSSDSPTASVVSVRMVSGSSQDKAELLNYLSSSSAGAKSDNESTQYMTASRTAVIVPKPINTGNIVCITASRPGESINLTGFVVEREGLIMCTAHFLSSKASIEIYTGKASAIKGRLVKIDRKKDVALIDCDYKFETAVDILKGESGLTDSQKITAYGCAEENDRQAINGTISGSPRKVDGQILWQAKMKVRPGDSGGPVFTENGVFAGIIKGGLRGRRDYTYIVPLDTLILFIKER